MLRHIPRTIKIANVNEGERRSDDLAQDGATVIGSTRRKYSLEELVAGIKPKNRHNKERIGASLAARKFSRRT